MKNNICLLMLAFASCCFCFGQLGPSVEKTDKLTTQSQIKLTT